MKKLNFTLAFVFVSLVSLAQSSVLKGYNLHQGTHKGSYFIFVNQDNKELEENLSGFLNNYGKVTNISKNTIRVEKLKGNQISENLEIIDVVTESTKKLQKICFFFLDRDENELNGFEIKDTKARAFIEDFQNHCLKNLDSKLAQENVKQTEEDLNSARRNQTKIEKALENNLKEQEKLGKKLDSTPELLTKALAEKEEIVGKLYSSDSTSIEKKDNSELAKASTKKEKEISKIQKEKEKAETKLSKKEADFEDLKNELFKAKAFVRSMELVAKDAKSALNGLR